jgi:hypothetical protein
LVFLEDLFRAQCNSTPPCFPYKEACKTLGSIPSTKETKQTKNPLSKFSLEEKYFHIIKAV